MRLTAEIVNARIASRGLRMTGAYTNAQTKTTFECAEGHEWEARPDSVMGSKNTPSTGCPHCPKARALSAEIINARISDRDLRMTGAYTNNITKTTFKCGEGHEWEATPSRVMGSPSTPGSGCTACARAAAIGRGGLTPEIINARLADRKIRMTGLYTNTSTKTTFECGDGHEWEAKPEGVMGAKNHHGSGCPHCLGVMPLTPEIINARLADRKIRMTGDYTTAATKTTFECGDGHEWEAKPEGVMGNKNRPGRGCPACAKYGYDQTAPGRLYLIALHDATTARDYVKVGITNQTIAQRFKNLPKTTTITATLLDDWHQLGSVPMNRETELKRVLAPFKTEDSGFMGRAAGESECYDPDCLPLLTHLTTNHESEAA